ncbi:MAG TPA: dephospho-CoA kinase [Bacilli bacterium]|nr:dephospho-CoA kinase [Bacilli bacterium]
MRMKKIGITGGIASGKSTIKDMLVRMNYHVIDSDKIASTLLDVGTPQYQKIITYFGEGVLNPNKTINRKILADIIFHDYGKKETLNRIIHPEVRKIIQIELDHFERLGELLIFIDVPLLYEAKFEDMFHKVIMVYVDEKIQLKRLMERDNITEDYALAKIQSQMSMKEKKKRADYVIDNSFSIIETKKQLMQVLTSIDQEV